jgi:hypothetical protein
LQIHISVSVIGPLILHKIFAELEPDPGGRFRPATGAGQRQGQYRQAGVFQLNDGAARKQENIRGQGIRRRSAATFGPDPDGNPDPSGRRIGTALKLTIEALPEILGIQTGGLIMKMPLSIVVAFVLTSPVYAGGDKHHTLTFDKVLGMPVVTIRTSQGNRRFVLDTGSVISSMDINRDKELELRVAGREITVRFRPTQTKVFREFEAMLPPTERVDGILGSDFMRHFRHVTFDFNGCLVSFD